MIPGLLDELPARGQGHGRGTLCLSLRRLHREWLLAASQSRRNAMDRAGPVDTLVDKLPRTEMRMASLQGWLERALGGIGCQMSEGPVYQTGETDTFLEAEGNHGTKSLH